MGFAPNRMDNMMPPADAPAPQAPMQETPAQESAEHKELVNLTKLVTNMGSQLERLASVVDGLAAKMAEDVREDAPEAEAEVAPAPAPEPAPRTSTPPTGPMTPPPGAPRIALPGGI